MRRCLAWSGVVAVLPLILQPESTGAQPLGGLIFGCDPRYGESVAAARARCEGESADNQASRILEDAQKREKFEQELLAVMAELRKRPPLPAAQNRLLGRWRAPRSPAASDPFAALLAGGAAVSLCSLMFAEGEVEFGPTRWATTDAAGRDDLGPASYRAASANAVAVLPDQGVQMMVFDILDANRVQLSGDASCILSRVGGQVR